MQRKGGEPGKEEAMPNAGRIGSLKAGTRLKETRTAFRTPQCRNPKPEPETLNPTSTNMEELQQEVNEGPPEPASAAAPPEAQCSTFSASMEHSFEKPPAGGPP